MGASLDDDLLVRHRIVKTVNELYHLRGSKYVQSVLTKEMLQEVRLQLEKHRPVLFSGTPCQLAGVRNFLKKQYDHLYCIDCCMHGSAFTIIV